MSSGSFSDGDGGTVTVEAGSGSVSGGSLSFLEIPAMIMEKNSTGSYPSIASAS